MDLQRIWGCIPSLEVIMGNSGNCDLDRKIHCCKCSAFKWFWLVVNQISLQLLIFKCSHLVYRVTTVVQIITLDYRYILCSKHNLLMKRKANNQNKNNKPNQKKTLVLIAARFCFVFFFLNLCLFTWEEF